MSEILLLMFRLTKTSKVENDAKKMNFL